MNEEKKYSDCPCCGECCEKPALFTPEHECDKDFCEDCYCTECKNCGKAGCHDL